MPIYKKEDIAGYIYRGDEFFCAECFDIDHEDPEDYEVLLTKELDEDKIYVCYKCKRQVVREPLIQE